MILTIFRPKRMKNGKPHISRSYRGRYRVEGKGKIIDVPLHTTDKRIAQQRLEQIVKEKQMEAEGLVPQQSLRTASQSPVETHLDDYIADLKAVKRDGQYVYELKNRICRLLRECKWKQLKDISADSFLKWRTQQTLATKTINEYLVSISSFLNWMENLERIERNPLKNVQKVQDNGEMVRPRRAFANDEFKRLLRVAGPRKVVYLTAVFTGLRRGELNALEWSDLHLDVEKPYLHARASTTKNHKDAVIGLHSDVVAELRKLRAKNEKSSGAVFAGLMPKMKVFKADLQMAGIPFLDSKGKRVDFHSLRHTLSTNMALAGTPPRVAMEIMRHSDIRLTSKTYTDAGKLPVIDAVSQLPSFSDSKDSEKADSQGASQNLFRSGPELSVPVNEKKYSSKTEVLEQKDLSHYLTVPVMPCPEKGEGCAIQGSNLSEFVETRRTCIVGYTYSYTRSIFEGN